MIYRVRLSGRVGSGWICRAADCESRARNARQTVTLTREVSTELELSKDLALLGPPDIYWQVRTDWGCQKVRCLESFVALPRLICKARPPNPFMV
jgi:hypothetical protein